MPLSLVRARATLRVWAVVQHIIKGMRPVPYLLKVAFPEVALIFKVIPLNETKNFVRGSFLVGLHLLAGHRFEVRRFVKEC